MTKQIIIQKIINAIESELSIDPEESNTVLSTNVKTSKNIRIVSTS